MLFELRLKDWRESVFQAEGTEDAKASAFSGYVWERGYGPAMSAASRSPNPHLVPGSNVPAPGDSHGLKQA